jgi:hypothetical protein
MEGRKDERTDGQRKNNIPLPNPSETNSDRQMEGRKDERTDGQRQNNIPLPNPSGGPISLNWFLKYVSTLKCWSSSLGGINLDQKGMIYSICIDVH